MGVDDGRRAGGDGDRPSVTLLCRVDVTAHDLPVEWTNGALFRFTDREAAESWASGQSELVHGTFYLTADGPEETAVPADLYMKYRSR